jgi:hypothetical protein
VLAMAGVLTISVIRSRQLRDSAKAPGSHE